MRTTLRHFHALLGVAAVTLLVSQAAAQGAPAAADDTKKTEDARARFQRGVELYKDGDYRASIIEFRRAYDLVPNWRIQYNLAQACAELQDYPCTMRALQAYLADGGSEVPADRRASIEAELKRVTGRIAHVSVTVNRPNAEVFADETSLGHTPLAAPALVSAGRRKLSATLPNGQTIAKVVELAGGDDLSVTLDFEAAPETPRRNDKSDSVKIVPDAPSSAPITIGLVTTGVLAAGTLTSGLLTLSSKSDLDKELDRFPGSEDAIAKARSRTETLGVVTDVVGVATVVAAGVTLYLALTRPSSPTPTKPSVGMSIMPGPTGISGRF
jgi:hypothetical protein